MIGNIRTLILASFIFAGFPASAVAVPSAKEAKAIEHLLAYIEKSSHTFHLGGLQLSGSEAAEQIRQKYNVETPRINTAGDFIDRTATKSVTGKRFLLRRADGSESELKGWLATELKKYRDQHPF